MLLSFLFSCNDKGGEEDIIEEEVFSCGEEVSLESDIMPIIQADCNTSRCHLDGPSPRLGTKEQVISNAERIKSEVVNGTMPPVEILDQEDIDLIACWVDDGAPDN